MTELFSEGLETQPSDDLIEPSVIFTAFLSSSFRPVVFQGINLFWFVNGVIYVFIILACLNYRIFYTSS
jgi:hypothetical protein